MKLGIKYVRFMPSFLQMKFHSIYVSNRNRHGILLQAIWENQFYYLFGFLFLVYVILIISCSQISIVMVYFQLCGEVRTVCFPSQGSWTKFHKNPLQMLLWNDRNVRLHFHRDLKYFFTFVGLSLVVEIVHHIRGISCLCVCVFYILLHYKSTKMSSFMDFSNAHTDTES